LATATVEYARIAEIEKARKTLVVVVRRDASLGRIVHEV